VRSRSSEAFTRLHPVRTMPGPPVFAGGSGPSAGSLSRQSGGHVRTLGRRHSHTCRLAIPARSPAASPAVGRELSHAHALRSSTEVTWRDSCARAADRFLGPLASVSLSGVLGAGRTRRPGRLDSAGGRRRHHLLTYLAVSPKWSCRRLPITCC
jgi:hypothetical protein